MRHPLLAGLIAVLLFGCSEPEGFGPLTEPSPGRTTTTPTGAGATGAGPARTITVATPGYRYEPMTVAVRPGEPVILELRNTDARTHSLTVNELSVQMAANPGETVRLPLRAPPDPGSFVMYCSVAGHLRAGHRGRFEVR